MAFIDLPLRRSMPLGIGAFLLGYGLSFLLGLGRISAVMAIEISGKYADPAPLGEILDTIPADWVVAGWLYYNAHLVPTSLPSSDAPGGLTLPSNYYLINEVGGALLVLYLLPPTLLICAGYLTVRTGSTFGADGERNAGASIAIGYFPVFVAGAFVFSASATNASASPHGLFSVGIGVLYPVVFGAIGGILAEKRLNQIEKSDGSATSID